MISRRAFIATSVAAALMPKPMPIEVTCDITLIASPTISYDEWLLAISRVSGIPIRYLLGIQPQAGLLEEA